MGKVKGKIISAGDIGNLRYTDGSGARIDLKYDQPYSTELGIADGTKVSFDIVVIDGNNMAVAVAPICKGTITAIDYPTGTGSITETESGIKYPFKQNYLKESGFLLNQIVTYNLVSVKGIANATCLTALPA